MVLILPGFLSSHDLLLRTPGIWERPILFQYGHLSTSYIRNEHLWWPHFQIRSHFEVLGMRTSTLSFWRDTIPPTTVILPDGGGCRASIEEQAGKSWHTLASSGPLWFPFHSVPNLLLLGFESFFPHFIYFFFIEGNIYTEQFTSNKCIAWRISTNSTYIVNSNWIKKPR